MRGHVLQEFQWKADGVVDELRALHKAGISARDAAEVLMRKFGGVVSRNAVMGKWFRLGLSTPFKPSANPRKRINKKAGSSRAILAGVKFNPEVRTPELERHHHEEIVDLCPDLIPIGQRKRLLDLKQGDCRFPYGDPGKPNFFFCGGDAGTASYCAFHCGIAFKGFGRPSAFHARRAA